MDVSGQLDAMRWTNPHGVDLSKPYVYLITIEAPHKIYRYVGKGIGASRLDAYARNVSRVLQGRTKRPETKKNGEPQRPGNLRYRYVHLPSRLRFATVGQSFTFRSRIAARTSTPRLKEH